MAALLDPMTGKLLNKALEKAFIEVGGVVNIILSSKTSGKELQEKLSWLTPTIDEIIKVEISDSNATPEIVRQYKDFQANLKEGLDLVEKLMKLHSFDIFRKYRYGKRVLNLQKKLCDFISFHGPPDVILNGIKLDADLNDYFQRLIGIVNAEMTNDPNSNTIMLQRIDATQVFQAPNDHGMHEATAAQQSIRCTCQVPEMPNEFVVGLKNPVNAVKKILLQIGVNIVEVTGMGGSGKTTLALALCNDTQVKDFFHNNIIFITVSQSANVNGVIEILETMWDKIIGDRRPHFRSVEDARFQLQTNLKRIAERTYRPTLVVLDDVWSRTDLEHLLFEAKGYKTVLTTRDDYAIPIRDGTRQQYKMLMLEDANALSLFCFWAFGQPSIPTTEEEDLVKQVAAECKGLPLALKVIGSCLCNEPRLSWESARNKLSRAESISEYYKDNVLNRLQMSIDILDDEPKQCFVDLGAFPEGRKFSVDSLLDIWVYVRGMEREDAFVVLLELAKRNLLNLTSNPGSGAIEYSCASELYFSQHDMMRDLALRLASQDSIIQRKRLFMPCKADNLPTEWLRTLTNQSSGAQFLSIHTGAMAEQVWCQIDFPEVEALALFFTASEYCLPTFLHSMPKLKVVFIYNYGSRRAILHGLPRFRSFTQIKSVLLERLIVSSLYDYCKSCESLEKLYVCLCEGLGNMTQLNTEQVFKLPKIVEINLDHCSDLEKLPGKIYNLTSLQRLSVTNCHLIRELPDDLGMLKSLKVLRLSACPGLSMLPPSICKLQQLEFLDISLCRSLKDLPMEFDQLSKLKMLDMRECSGLKKLPKALAKLRSLKRVICDENTERQWRSIQTSAMPNLKIDPVEERFNLDWLDD